MSKYLIEGFSEDVQHIINPFYIAEQLMLKWHEGQLDKAGKPYSDHLYRVADKVSKHPMTTPGAIIVALLHDLFEDTEATQAQVASALDKAYQGDTYYIRDCIEVLTRHRNIPEIRYYQGITRYFDTLIVKIADMEDNLNPERLALLPEEAREKLVNKYTPWYTALKEEEQAVMSKLRRRGQ